MGTLTLRSLAGLRAEAGSGRLRLSIVEGDVRAMHRARNDRGALFQGASQFNTLEMVGPDVIPERDVTVCLPARAVRSCGTGPAERLCRSEVMR